MGAKQLGIKDNMALKGQFTQMQSLCMRGNPFWVGLDYSINLLFLILIIDF